MNRSHLASLIVAAVLAPAAQPGVEQYLISTVAGGTTPATAAPGTSVDVGELTGIASDSSGDIYFSSVTYHSVFKLDVKGVLTRVAGTGSAGYSADGELAVNARLNDPEGLAVDSSGNLYIADTANGRVRKVTADGRITTVAGGGDAGNSGDGGPAIRAQLRGITGLALDAAGNLYISEYGGHSVHRVSPDGVIRRVAGDGTEGFSGDGGPSRSARLGFPAGMAVDTSGNLYIADSSNSRIRRVSANGTITTVAGNGTSGYSGDGGPATSAQLYYPKGVAFDASGTLHIADSLNGRVRKVSRTGRITTVAGGGDGYSGDGGPAVLARFLQIWSLTLDKAGNIFTTDRYNRRIRKISVAGTIETVAGGSNGDRGFSVFAHLNFPRGAAVDKSGNVYVADLGSHRIRKIAPGGVITTVAGKGTSGFSGDGGPAISAELDSPESVAVDETGKSLHLGHTE